MRLLIISNRLPIAIKCEPDHFLYEKSIGGLASGISDYLEYLKNNQTNISECLWSGWAGISQPSAAKKIKLTHELNTKFQLHPVFLSNKQIQSFYHGFCNKTLWPLFHYLPAFVTYEPDHWLSYTQVNEIFCQELVSICRPDDIIWIHDYQLLLLPALLRKKFPQIKIGFFLHIPFPSFEMFRLLPQKWRVILLEGMLGADLIGFHTHEYTQYFLNCVHRIIGADHNMGKLIYESRSIKADTFPMGINFDNFATASNSLPVQNEIVNLKNTLKDRKIVLSIDRLDYTKGIQNRLYGYEKFLETYPEWHSKIVLFLIAVPSRVIIDHYQQLKHQIDETVGKINGRFGNFSWSPILYQYKSFDFSSLAAIYAISDIALLTPFRDGMNLIAKEYLATKNDDKGVLILSEMAGAAKELGEAILINPNDIEEISTAIHSALTISTDEQIQRNRLMRARLKTYNVMHWGDDFLRQLEIIYAARCKIKSQVMSYLKQNELCIAFQGAKKPILFLDYDGTLMPATKYPYQARPSVELLDLLRKISALANVDLVIISGRIRNTLENWFISIPKINLVAEYGVWIKAKEREWQLLKPVSDAWKPALLNILETYTQRIPRTFIENKEYSLSWNYSNAEPEFAAMRAKELMDDLVNFIANTDLQVMQSKTTIEIKSASINKGSAALFFLGKQNYDFILAMGDDVADEELFRALPNMGYTYTVKVGMEQSVAKYKLYNTVDVMRLLLKLIENTN